MQVNYQDYQQYNNSSINHDFHNYKQKEYNIYDLIDSFETIKSIIPEVLDDKRLENISKSFYIICTNKNCSEIIIEKFKASSDESKSLFISKILHQLCEISNTEHGSSLILNIILNSTNHIQSFCNYLQYGLLCFTKYGSWLVCEMFKIFSPIVLDILTYQLVNHFDQLSIDEFRSKMILQLIETQLDVKYIDQIYLNISKNFFTLSCKNYSYKVIRNWMQLYPQYIRNIIGLIIRTWRSDQPSIIPLTNDQYAKYVIDIVLKFIEPDLKEIIKKQLEEYDPCHAKHLKEVGINKDMNKNDSPTIDVKENNKNKKKDSRKSRQKSKPLAFQFVPERKKELIDDKSKGDNVISIPFDSSSSLSKVKDIENKKYNLSISLPMQLAFALTNDNIKRNEESLIPEEDRMPLWDDINDVNPYYGFYTLPIKNEYITNDDNVADNNLKGEKLISAVSILHYELEDEDSKLLDDDIHKRYPNLDICEDYDPLDWIIHDYDIEEYFEKEWNEEEFFKQLDFENYLHTIGLSGDQDEIDWKIGDNCEVCINMETIYETQKRIINNSFIFNGTDINDQQWLIGRIHGVSKGTNNKLKMFQIKLLLNNNKIVITSAKNIRPIIKHYYYESK